MAARKSDRPIMSTQTVPLTSDAPARFAAGASAFMLLAAAVTGWLPIGVSIVAVFLCAGPHNWVEARYFLTRLPGRWGKLQGFFITALGGVALLTAGFAAIPWLAAEDNWLTAIALWNTLLTLWIAALVQMRSRQNPRRDWGWIWPAAFGVIALAWMLPLAWDLALVYLHPLVALWILDREIGRSAPEYRRAYRACLLLVPVCVAGLCWRLAGAPNLPGDDALTERITHHAGADILAGVSTHLLVALHTFLEVLHYGVWLILIPLVARDTALWNIERTPLARRSAAWSRGLRTFILAGLGLVALLWLGFLGNYPITRDVYFTVAMAHVLAEVPFLLRAL
jgi:hypothetical protein